VIVSRLVMVEGARREAAGAVSEPVFVVSV
jgi:hypothetical protein